MVPSHTEQQAAAHRSHSATSTTESKHWQTVRWGERAFRLTAQTFRPRETSLPFVELALEATTLFARPSTLIDMCCGCGALGISLYLARPDAFTSILALDSSADAVESCRANFSLHGVPGDARLWRAGTPVDVSAPTLVLCNPPFLPIADAGEDTLWERACIYATDDGMRVASQCMESIVGTSSVIVLKSMVHHVVSLSEQFQTSHFVYKLRHGEIVGRSPVAYSLWEPTDSRWVEGRRA